MPSALDIGDYYVEVEAEEREVKRSCRAESNVGCVKRLCYYKSEATDVMELCRYDFDRQKVAEVKKFAEDSAKWAGYAFSVAVGYALLPAAPWVGLVGGAVANCVANELLSSAFEIPVWVHDDTVIFYKEWDVTRYVWKKSKYVVDDNSHSGNQDFFLDIYGVFKMRYQEIQYINMDDEKDVIKEYESMRVTSHGTGMLPVGDKSESWIWDKRPDELPNAGYGLLEPSFLYPPKPENSK